MPPTVPLILVRSRSRNLSPIIVVTLSFRSILCYGTDKTFQGEVASSIFDVLKTLESIVYKAT